MRVSGESIVRAETAVRTFSRRLESAGQVRQLLCIFHNIVKKIRASSYKFGDERESGAGR